MVENRNSKRLHASKKTRKKIAKKTMKKVAKKAVKKATVKRAMKRSRVVVKRRRFANPEMATMNDLKVNKAEYVEGYTLLLTFNAGYSQKVDFSSFLEGVKAPYLAKYRKFENFKNFKIEEGNIVWGKDWDLIFPISQLVKNKVTARS